MKVDKSSMMGNVICVFAIITTEQVTFGFPRSCAVSGHAKEFGPLVLARAFSASARPRVHGHHVRLAFGGARAEKSSTHIPGLMGDVGRGAVRPGQAC